MNLPPARACLALVIVSTLLNQSLAAESPASPEQPGRMVALSAGDIARLGIQVQPIEAASFTPRVHGYGVVVDLSALAQADANLTMAAAAARQSLADLRRARALYRQSMAVSRQAVDAAERQASDANAQLQLAERQEVVQFGPQAPWIGARGDRSSLTELVSGRAVLLRATFPIDTINSTPAELSVTHLSAEDNPHGWTTRRIWSAPADPTIPGRSYFAIVAGSDLQSGEHALVYAPVGAALTGVRIPSDAVLLSDAKPWCYIQVSPGYFRRLQIDLNRPLSGGYFVANRFGAGRSVVVRGAGLLLSRELGAATLPRD